MTEDQIKHLVNRFLSWKLPANFRPDAGISYVPTSHADKLPPSGTNLFDATQADAMVRYMLDGMPPVIHAQQEQEPIAEPVNDAYKLPELPDDDADFTPDLARKIIAKYQALVAQRIEQPTSNRQVAGSIPAERASPSLPPHSASISKAMMRELVISSPLDYRSWLSIEGALDRALASHSQEAPAPHNSEPPEIVRTLNKKLEEAFDEIERLRLRELTASLRATAPHERRANQMAGWWTHDAEAAKDIGDHLYYFAPASRTPPPYKTQRHVTAIIDVASDGTLAGVELINDMPPPPLHHSQEVKAK